MLDSIVIFIHILPHNNLIRNLNFSILVETFLYFVIGLSILCNLLSSDLCQNYDVYSIWTEGYKQNLCLRLKGHTLISLYQGNDSSVLNSTNNLLCVLYFSSIYSEYHYILRLRVPQMRETNLKHHSKSKGC